jgi:hypothetical protein
MSALSDPNSFTISVTIPELLHSNKALKALVDSGSSHCFVDPSVISKFHLISSNIPPIQLHLFDGSSNSVILQEIVLPICFATGETTPYTFLVTLLDSSCSLVLGLRVPYL